MIYYVLIMMIYLYVSVITCFLQNDVLSRAGLGLLTHCDLVTP